MARAVAEEGVAAEETEEGGGVREGMVGGAEGSRELQVAGRGDSAPESEKDGVVS